MINYYLSKLIIINITPFNRMLSDEWWPSRTTVKITPRQCLKILNNTWNLPRDQWKLIDIFTSRAVQYYNYYLHQNTFHSYLIINNNDASIIDSIKTRLLVGISIKYVYLLDSCTTIIVYKNLDGPTNKWYFIVQLNVYFSMNRTRRI